MTTPFLYRLALRLRPLMQWLPRGNVWLYCACCDRIPKEFWRAMPDRFVVFRDTLLDAIVIVDLADMRGRSHYFLGSFQDPANRTLIGSWLRPGDTFIDVGASLGFHSLHASRVVGAGGRVISFEPEPGSFSLFQAHLAINRIANCEAHPVALGDGEGEMSLAVKEDPVGTSTLREAPEAACRVPVRVARGDRLIDLGTRGGRVLVKIDVEGFEHQVIRGLGRILQGRDTALSVEVTDEWLRQTGSSAADLFRDLKDLGYTAYLPEPRRRGRGWSLELLPLTSPASLPQYDAFFFRTEDPSLRSVPIHRPRTRLTSICGPGPSESYAGARNRLHLPE